MMNVDTSALTAGFRMRADPAEVEEWKAAAAEEGVSVAELLRQQAASSPTLKDAVRAHAAVAKALADGTLVRQPCEECGASADGHHDDYSKPLDVRWLCKKHHRLWHRDHPTGVEWPTSLRLPDDLHAELTALAAANMRSLNNEIILRLRSSLMVAPVTLSAQAAATEMTDLADGALEDAKGAAQAVMALAERGKADDVSRVSVAQPSSGDSRPSPGSSPRSASAAKQPKRSSGAMSMCEHRVPTGSYCKRCQEIV